MLEKTFESPLECKEINQSIVKEISPEYSLEGQMLKLKLQYFGHPMRRRQRECSDELIVVTCWNNWWFSILLTFCVFPVCITGVNYFDKQ